MHYIVLNLYKATLSKMKKIILLLCLVHFSLSAQNLEIRVINKCPFPIWSHAFAYKLFTSIPEPIDGGKATQLYPGDSVIYGGLPPIGGGRVYGYYKQPPVGATSLLAPLSTYNQFVEMTLENTALNYNISYVDHTALPVSVTGRGNCVPTASNVNSVEWKKKLLSCPTIVTNQYNGIGTCLASYDYCLLYPASDYCKKMEVYGGGRFTGTAIYGGTMPYPSSDVAFWDSVAAWNRGADPGDPDASNYYLGPQKVGSAWFKPYNEYAAWVHKDIGAEIYAFSTDDHQDHSGFQRCLNSKIMEVIWCPCECTVKIKDTLITAPSCANNDGQISIVDSGGRGPVQYSIDGVNYSTSAIFKNISPGNYKIYVRDSMNCSDSANITLQQKPAAACDTSVVLPITEEVVLKWPNVISPNNDGVNDAFKAVGVDDSNFQKVIANITFISFSVFNRWGNIVYYSEDDMLPNWDGKFNGQAVSSGTYYFFIRYSTAGKIHEISGNITVL